MELKIHLYQFSCSNGSVYIKTRNYSRIKHFFLLKFYSFQLFEEIQKRHYTLKSTNSIFSSEFFLFHYMREQNFLHGGFACGKIFWSSIISAFKSFATLISSIRRNIYLSKFTIFCS